MGSNKIINKAWPCHRQKHAGFPTKKKKEKKICPTRWQCSETSAKKTSRFLKFSHLTKF